ncbi:hypothetical protein PO486_14020 [Atlantibacter hermannii]
MATNDFKPFATGAGANVMSQSDYQALEALITGFQSGKASSAQVNKALRQATFISSALAQFVADKTGQDVLDDGNLSAFVAKLTNGFGKQFLSRGNPFSDIKSDGATAINTALNNLGLNDSNGYVGRLLGAPKVFGTSGSYTPGVNVKAIVVEIVGGGGGGGAASSSANYNAAGGGGGGGGYAKKYIPISSTAAIAYTVGQGGNGATYPAVSGQNGGATTFGSGFTATGGSGGNTASSNASSSLVGMGGGGGTASGGNINSTGSGGQNGVSSSPTIAGGTMGAGFGGASVVSGQGGPGGGGPGAVTTSGNQNVNGNRGNDGLIIIWEYA